LLAIHSQIFPSRFFLGACPHTFHSRSNSLACLCQPASFPRRSPTPCHFFYSPTVSYRARDAHPPSSFYPKSGARAATLKAPCVGPSLIIFLCSGSSATCSLADKKGSIPHANGFYTLRLAGSITVCSALSGCLAPEAVRVSSCPFVSSAPYSSRFKYQQVALPSPDLDNAVGEAKATEQHLTEAMLPGFAVMARSLC